MATKGAETSKRSQVAYSCLISKRSSLNGGPALRVFALCQGLLYDFRNWWSAVAHCFIFQTTSCQVSPQKAIRTTEPYFGLLHYSRRQMHHHVGSEGAYYIHTPSECPEQCKVKTLMILIHCTGKFWSHKPLSPRVSLIESWAVMRQPFCSTHSNRYSENSKLNLKFCVALCNVIWKSYA